MRRFVPLAAAVLCVPLVAGCATSTPTGQLQPRSVTPLGEKESVPSKETREVLRSAYEDNGISTDYGGDRIEVEGRYDLEVACRAEGAKAWWWVVVDGDVESWGQIDCGKKYRYRVLSKTHASHSVNIHLGTPEVDGEDSAQTQWGYARLLKAG